MLLAVDAFSWLLISIWHIFLICGLDAPNVHWFCVFNTWCPFMRENIIVTAFVSTWKMQWPRRLTKSTKELNFLSIMISLRNGLHFRVRCAKNNSQRWYLQSSSSFSITPIPSILRKLGLRTHCSKDRIHIHQMKYIYRQWSGWTMQITAIYIEFMK